MTCKTLFALSFLGSLCVVGCGGGSMYYMIYATDHPDGPTLMSRAYRSTVLPLEPPEQLKLELEPVSVDGAKTPRIPV